MVDDDEVLRNMFETKRGEVKKFGKLHNEYKNFRSPYTVRFTQSKRMRWVGRVA